MSGLKSYIAQRRAEDHKRSKVLGRVRRANFALMSAASESGQRRAPAPVRPRARSRDEVLEELARLRREYYSLENARARERRDQQHRDHERAMFKAIYEIRDGDGWPKWAGSGADYGRFVQVMRRELQRRYPREWTAWKRAHSLKPFDERLLRDIFNEK